MSNIQSMLAIGSLFLLSFISMNFNSALLQSNTVEIREQSLLNCFFY